MKIRLEKTKAFWLYILGGIICVGLGAILLPVWPASVFFSGWGGKSVNIMISGLLLAYILLYLIKRINRYSGTPAQIVAIVELVLMAVIAVVCTVSAFFETVRLGDPCQIFGLVLWTRGASGVFTGYYCDSSLAKKKKKGEKEKKPEVNGDEEPRGRVDDFTVWRLTLAVALISVGTYLFILPPFGTNHLQWVFSCAIVAVGLFFTVYGFALKPSKVRVNEVLENTAPTSQGAGEVKTPAKEEKSEPVLDEGKVKIKLDNSATAMTKTAAYDAVKEENALTVTEDKK